MMDNIWFIGFLGGKIWTGSENISCVSDEFFFFFRFVSASKDNSNDIIIECFFFF